MTIIRALVGASALFLLAPMPQAQAATECHTIEICVDLIVVSGCYSYERCTGEENDTIA